MTNTQGAVYTTRRCTCDATPPIVCSYPFCITRRCGRCHICRFVGADTIPVLTADEKRFYEAWQQVAPSFMVPDRLTATDTRLLFKLADMGLFDA